MELVVITVESILPDEAAVLNRLLGEWSGKLHLRKPGVAHDRLRDIIGGINWGLVGVADFNLVNFILGFAPILERIVYILVGLSAIYAAYDSFKK